MKTLMPKIGPTDRKWYVVDLQGQTLGRVAVQVATVLRGKHKPIFTPHLDTGDFIIAINASGLRVTGNFKTRGLKYYHYSGYPGGLRTRTFEEQMRRRPETAFEHAVWRMLPKNRLGKKLIKKLHVYSGAEHPHAAQKPEPLELKKK